MSRPIPPAMQERMRLLQGLIWSARDQGDRMVENLCMQELSMLLREDWTRLWEETTPNESS